jgi:hypothetical protein
MRRASSHLSPHGALIDEQREGGERAATHLYVECRTGYGASGSFRYTIRLNLLAAPAEAAVWMFDSRPTTV